MHLRTVTTDQEFHGLRDAWEALTSEPLNSFDWHFGWWKHFREDFELRIYVFEKNGEIIGIAPFFVDGWMGQRRLRLLGSGKTCTDYGQVIANPQYLYEFCRAITGDIVESKMIGMVELEGVRETDGLSCLCHHLDNSQWRYDKLLESTWVVDLPDRWDDFVSGSHKSLKRKIRKATKRLESGQARIHSTLGVLSFDAAFNELVRLHQKRFNSKGLPGVFQDNRFTRFLNDVARPLCADRRAEIVIGEMNKVPFAAQLYVIPKSGPQMYQTGISPDSLKYEPGHLMFTYAVRKSIEAGYSKFDFLRGDEPYKPFWGAQPQPLLMIRYVSKQLAPTVINQAYRGLRTVKNNCSTIWAGLTTSH